MRRSYNEQLPISRLPVELFINIIHLAVHGDPALHYTTLYKLVGVSSRWASWINSSSSLWSIIHARHTSQLQATTLARSGTSLLSLIDDVVGVPGKLAFLANTLPHVYRWRSFEYGGNRAVSDYYLNDLVDAPAPKLESLIIDVLRGLNMKVDLFRGEAPRLQHLELSGCPIPWESNMLSGLKTLKLMYLGTLGPSMDQVIGILLASPALVDLVLGSLFERSQDIVTSNSRTIELPYLRSLSLTGLSSVAIALLFTPHTARISASIYKRIEVTFK
ncbi:hypothetical protein FRB94_012321 [Tulasnella sp. JGI-2019a]|nr:hypothetical protein FRB94_012321 [Tulasnella sp. JGI-2019a]